MSDHETVHWFLDNLQLSQYTTAFLERGYDTGEKCNQLTNSDLDVIGVTLIGHRKRILMATGGSDACEGDDGTEEEDQELYDVLPTPKPVSQPKTVVSEADYMNLRELDTIPPPLLPPKTKKYSGRDDLEKFGMVKETNVAEMSAANKRAPLPVPRKAMPAPASEKPKLPPLRITKLTEKADGKSYFSDLSCSSAPVSTSASGGNKFDNFPSVNALTNMWNDSVKAVGTSVVNKTFVKAVVGEKPPIPTKPPVSAKKIQTAPTEASLNLISFDIYGTAGNWNAQPDEVEEEDLPFYDTLTRQTDPPRSSDSPTNSESASIYDEIMCDNDPNVPNTSWTPTFCTTATSAPFSQKLVSCPKIDDVSVHSNTQVRESFYSAEKPETSGVCEPIYEDEVLPQAAVHGCVELQTDKTDPNFYESPSEPIHAAFSPFPRMDDVPVLPLKTRIPMGATSSPRLLSTPPPVPNRLNAPPPVPTRSNSALSFTTLTSPDSSMSVSSLVARGESFDKKFAESEDYVFPDGEPHRAEALVDRKARNRTSLTSLMFPLRIKRDQELLSSYDGEEKIFKVSR